MDRSAAEEPGQPALKEQEQLTLFDEPPHEDAAPVRLALLEGRPVEFRFRRRRRRTIAIKVSEQGLAVSAPLCAPWREVEGFLHEKARWILRKLDERAAAGRPRLIFGAHGETLPLHGESRRRLGGGARSLALEDLQLRSRAGRRGAVRRLLLGWLKERALETLAPRVAHYAARVSLPAPPLALSNARTQWGVCMASGRIRLSWRLVHLRPELADYVVAHEIAHLVELNHSERFWALVEWLYPHWREARERIERDAATLPRL
jgi:predicted metal-dependent hydrolase